MYKFTYPLIKSKIKTWLKYYIAKMGQKAKYILSEILNNILPITLENTAPEYPFNIFEIQGNTFQQTYTGKNLFNINNIPNTTYQTVSNDTLIINGENYSNTNKKLSELAPSLTIGKTYCLNLISNASDHSTMLYLTGSGISWYINVAKEMTQAMLDSNVVFYGGDNKSATISNIQIEEGTSATSYEPYVGGIPSPNPSFPQNVEVVTGENSIVVSNKNMFDITKLVMTSNTTISGNKLILEGTTEYHSTANDNHLKDFAPQLEVGQTYTLTFDTTYTSKNYIYLRGAQSNWNNGDSIVITQAILDDRIAFYGTNGAEITNIQIEKGSTATSYIEHAEQNYPISLGSIELCKIGNYKDVIFKNEPSNPLYNSNLVENGWYVHKETGNVVYDTQNLPVEASGSLVNVYRFNKTGITNFLPVNANGTGLSNILSTIIANYPNDTQSYFLVSGQLTFKLNKTILDSYTGTTPLEKLEAYIIDKGNIKFYYRLETPTDTQITDTTLIEQLEALNNAYTYEDQTNISWTGDLAAYLKLQYYIKEDTNNE